MNTASRVGSRELLNHRLQELDYTLVSCFEQLFSHSLAGSWPIEIVNSKGQIMIFT